LFEAQIKEGQDFAYGLAEELRDQLFAAEPEARKAPVDETSSAQLLLENGLTADDGDLDLS